MKIDIHVHTRKTKIGDSKARDVTPEQFARTVLSTDVKILAITNHNAFDLAQYEEITKQVDGAVQVWPGVELDVCCHRPDRVPFSAESPEPGDHPGVKVAVGGFRVEAGG
jgi:histidinol phosphatase-like PHP family hydrolase